MRQDPKPYELYKHFKGNTYQIICLAKDSEDGSTKVVYQGMYEPYTIYVRSLDMFMEEVDRTKYPEVLQKYRFELVAGSDNTKLESETINEKVCVTESDSIQEAVSEPAKETAPVNQANTSESINSGLIRFLDAETDEEKLAVFTALKEELNENILTSIELSLGMEAGEGDILERYREVKNFLMLKQKYERRHR